MNPIIRLYGHQLGFASFSQVTRGFVEALEATELFGGFVPVDYRDDETSYPGATAPVSVNCGAPSAVELTKAIGDHKERWLLLAPNSDRVPVKMQQFLTMFVTGLLAPSKWAEGVLRRTFPELEVKYCPHGVQSGMHVDAQMRIGVRTAFQQEGRFVVLHLTSTNAQRKGTRELIEAWRGYEKHDQGILRIVARHEGAAEYREMTADMGSRVEVIASQGQRPDVLHHLLSTSHVICQPSRSEGFGLVPLEARACGVPVVATACTGHADHMVEGDEPAPGVVVIPSGDEDLIDDLPNARAPTITAEDVYGSLVEAEDRWLSLHEAAIDNAPNVQRDWAWPVKTGTTLIEIAGRYM
jgi:glycosyltransferase involved in cell wall biosynthesis